MLAEIKKMRMANAIIRITHECDAGMKQGVKYYRAAVMVGDAVEATKQIKRAARLPYRVAARIQPLVTKHGNAAMNAALALVSTQTLASLNAELNPLKAYSDVLKDNFRNQGWTEAQIADDIDANRADIDTDESAPVPSGYIDEL